MSTSLQSQNTTRMFARVVGPFVAVLCLTAAVQGPQLWTRVSEAADDPLWSWVAGAFTLLVGLVVIALHPYWRGVAAFSVSALGWLTAVKGLLLVAFPGDGVTSSGRHDGYGRGVPRCVCRVRGVGVVPDVSRAGPGRAG